MHYKKDIHVLSGKCLVALMCSYQNWMIMSLSARLKKIDNKHVDDIIVIGTAAFLDVKWKGQDLVIKALGALKKKGITNIRFEMIGIGTGTYLRKIAKENNVLDQVKDYRTC